MQHSAIMTIMIRAVRKAARPLAHDFGEIEHLQASRKGPADFVRAAIRKSEKTLLEELKAARPDYGFMSEDKGEVVGKDPSQRWIIDPLDGTINFLHSLPLFSLTVALEREGLLSAAVIYNPVTDELFSAQRGVGSFLNDRRLRVAGRAHLVDSVVAFGLPHHKTKGPETFPGTLSQFAARVSGIRDLGSPALSLAWLAAGRLDGFLCKGLNPWEVAAGTLMVQEAGGLVTDLENENNRQKKGHICVGNPSLHPQLLALGSALKS